MCAELRTHDVCGGGGPWQGHHAMENETWVKICYVTVKARVRSLLACRYVHTSGMHLTYLQTKLVSPSHKSSLDVQPPSRHIMQQWRRYDVKMTSFWRYNDVIITSCVQ